MPPLEDPVDRILWRELHGLPERAPGILAVVDDPTGALTCALAERGRGPVRVHCDSLAAERRVAAAAALRGADVELVPAPDESLFAGASAVVCRLPKALDALDEWAAAASQFGRDDAVFLGGARVKHLSRGMNEILGRHYDAVSASLGVQKCRALIARGPRRAAGPVAVRHRDHPELNLRLCASGGVFAGTGVDTGTRLLLGVLEVAPTASTVLDLGCGNGVLAATLATRLPDAAIHAVDESAAAVRSAAATARANQLQDRITVTRADDLAMLPQASVDAIVCNPPFHRGTVKDSTAAFAMIGEAARVLRPGGELWLVFNSHLPYLPRVRQVVGRTRLVARNPHYLVTRSERRSG